MIVLLGKQVYRGIVDKKMIRGILPISSRINTFQKKAPIDKPSGLNILI